jgi:hypothetical protein
MEFLNNFESDLDYLNNIEIMESNSFRRKKNYKQRFDPFTSLNEKDFRMKYRLSKNVVRYVVNLISSDLGGSSETRGGKISPELQVLACLRYWGRGEVRINKNSK